MTNVHSCRLPLRALGLGLLLALAGPTLAQPLPATPQEAYAELQLARHWALLGLSAAQAQALIPVVQQVIINTNALDDLDTQFNVQTAGLAATVVRAELNNDSAAVAYQRGTLAQAWADHQAARAIYLAAREQAELLAWGSLSLAQQALVEGADQARARRAGEAQTHARRVQIVAAAARELTWVREATDAEYMTGRLARAQHLAHSMWPGTDPAWVAGIANRLGVYFDSLRRMSAESYAAAQPGLEAQISGILVPAPPQAARVWLTQEDWLDLLRHPRSSILLADLARALAAGATP